jgi:light-regulated signal transduction histidine kinase (bacteriophytochrome)
MKAFIVKNYSPIYSNYRATESLGDFLKKFKIPGIYDIDTRMLVRHLRDKGAMRGIVSSVDLDTASLLKKVKASPDMNGWDLATLVTHKEKKTYKVTGEKKFTVAAFDFGMKQNIIDRLNFYGIEVIRVPAQTTFEEVKKLNSNIHIPFPEEKFKNINDSMIVTVSDSGTGIGQGDMKELFNKFKQLGNRSETSVKGSGLGLAIAKGIIEQHGGVIGAESELGVGSMFYFMLPLQ